MGACMGRNSVYIDVYQAPTLAEVLQDGSDDLELSADGTINYNLHIYLYQKQIHKRERELLSWCSSKLALTEDIIRINRARLQKNTSTSSENESIKDGIQDEIIQLQTYRQKLIELIRHLKKCNRNKIPTHVRRKKPHKCAVKIITALTEAISKV